MIESALLKVFLVFMVSSQLLFILAPRFRSDATYQIDNEAALAAGTCGEWQQPLRSTCLLGLFTVVAKINALNPSWRASLGSHLLCIIKWGELLNALCWRSCVCGGLPELVSQRQ